jgi:GAF domain-containing protein
MASDERSTLDTFVELADSLTNDYDVSEFLTVLVERCAEVFDAACAGVMLESPEGVLRLAAGSSTEMKDLEQAEIDNEDGPCHEAYRTGEPVVADDLDHSDVAERWPSVVDHMRRLGLKAVYAFPLRLRDDRIGALNMYRTAPGKFAADDIRLAQAFADVATIGILQERKVTSAELRAGQLQHALDSRLVIEQAKGLVSAQLGISLADAFDAIRRHARSNNRTIHDVAHSIVDHGAAALDDDSG